MKDNFTIWIKNKINGGSIEPPKEAWSNISNKLDIEDSWSPINKKLDIDQVWGRLDYQLDKDLKMKRYERMTYAPLLLLLLLLGWNTANNQLFTEEQNNNVISEISENRSESITSKEDDQQLKDKSLQSANTENLKSSKEKVTTTQQVFDKKINTAKKISKNNNISIEGNDTLTERKVSLPNKNTNLINNETPDLFKERDIIAAQSAILIAKLNPIEANLGYDSIPLEQRSLDYIVIEEELKSEDKVENYWYTAIGLSANRSWLNDNRLKRATEGSQLYKATGANNLSANIQLGYVLNDNWAIHSEAIILGRVGQEYGEYINGKYRNGSIDVNYNGLKIGVRRSLPAFILPGEKNRNYILAGIYGNHIYAVNQFEGISINNESNSFNLTNNYKKLDMGIWGGIELNRKLNRDFELGAVLSYRYGLNNIYSGEDGIPSYLRKTNTSEISLTLFLRRNFK